MNSRLRWFGPLLLTMVTGCALQSGPPSEDGTGDHAPGAVSAHDSGRVGAPFSPRLLDQLAARGINVHGSDGKPASTTVENKWIVVDDPDLEFKHEANTDPTTKPEMFATHVSIHWPRSLLRAGKLPIVYRTKEPLLGNCSGTLVASDAVLTAAHCIVDYCDIGIDPLNNEVVRARVPSYNIEVRPRRNGSGDPAHLEPHGYHTVGASKWRFSDWPGDDPDVYESEHDFAILRLKTHSALETAGPRAIQQPALGKEIVAAHYPMAPYRSYRMFRSSGTITDELDDNYYSTNLSIEPGSSGGGVFETEFGIVEDGVIGVITAEIRTENSGKNRVPGQTEPGSPNRVLLFASDMLTDIEEWIAMSI